MKLLAKVAMVLSFAYYSLTMAFVWIGQIFGWHQDVWDLFGFPTQSTSPPMLSLLAGVAVVVFTLAGLFAAYVGIWRILDGGPQQDFRQLARRMRRIGRGLIVFWAGFNLLVGGVQYLLVIGLEDTSDFDFGFDPLDVDILFLIIGIAVLAIAQTLRRAWEAEEENQAFL